jgi:hypothetical protein
MSSSPTFVVLSSHKHHSTGLPAESEGYDSLSDSDEEYIDEADEDSNGKHKPSFLYPLTLPTIFFSGGVLQE